MADLPTGTVTFLFTDLEGSTTLLQAHPAAYRDAVRRHHALLRGAVEAHGGVVFETVGDAVYAAFERPTDAVAAAIAGQLALQREDWGELGAGALKARMGLHAGEVERQGAHYFGAPLYRCARLTATAHGGQTVLSEAAVALVRDALPARVGLLDLGEYRLKDLQRPERVFQLTAPGLPGEFPALRALDTLPNNLPLQLTSFVGRERELGEVAALLGAHRLLTLTGPGGTGKTRLALQAAADALEQYPDGVWLVELAALAEPALVAQAVASAVGVREDPGRPLLATLTDALRPRRLLLLLDNCEHLLDACARLADGLLRACPRLTILATSREALGIAGETAWRVPSLSLPDPRDAQRPWPLEGLTQYEAVRLFIDRAVAVQPAFQVTNQNAPAVAQICQRLDGIPLALELAAVRVRVLPPEQLLRRLEDRFRLLTGGSRTVLERHQTLRGAVDWSYDLLSDQEQILFARLSVFAGGWTLEAAEAVGAGDGLAPPDVLDLLTRLVDQSLVVVDAQPDGTARYRLLETLRQYARERLPSAEVAALRDRHVAWALALAEEVAPILHGPRLVEGLDRLDAELDNLRAALRWAAEGGRVEHGLRLGSALWWWWHYRGRVPEGRAALAVLVAHPGAAAPTLGRARALVVLAQLYGTYGGSAADPAQRRAFVEEGLALARELGDRHGEGWALVVRGVADREAALAIFCALGDVWAAASAQYFAGAGLVNKPDGLGSARALYVESLALYRETGDPFGISRALMRLGYVALQSGDAATARPLLEESLALCHRIGDRQGVGFTLKNLGDVAADLGEPALAHARYAESLATWVEVGYLVGVADDLRRLAAVAVAQGQLARAVRLAGAAARQQEALGGSSQSPRDQARHERVVETARRALGAAAAAAWAAGEAMTLDQAIAYALEEPGAAAGDAG